VNGRARDLISFGVALALAACARQAKDTTDEAGRVDTQASPATQRDTQPTPTPAPAQTSAPRIERVVPDSARVGTAVDEVRIVGTGFEPGRSGQNTVDIGPMIHMTMVPANDAGTEIRITVPMETQGTAQTRPRRVMPGTFDVTVTTRAGVSNAIPLRLLP
jgi:hypothetical protein